MYYWHTTPVYLSARQYPHRSSSGQLLFCSCFHEFGSSSHRSGRFISLFLEFWLWIFLILRPSSHWVSSAQYSVMLFHLFTWCLSNHPKSFSFTRFMRLIFCIVTRRERNHFHQNTLILRIYRNRASQVLMSYNSWCCSRLLPWTCRSGQENFKMI